MNSKPQRLSDMVRQDLANIANELPYTGQDHKSNLLYHFEEGGWDQVDIYIECVKAYNNPVLNTSYFKALQDAIYSKWCQCMDWILKFAVEAKTWLNG